MKRTVRLTESDLSRLVRRIINESKIDKKRSLKEGIGTGILILSGLGVLYLGRKIKKFIDNYGKYFSSVQLGSFLSKIESIESGREDGKVVVK